MGMNPVVAAMLMARLLHRRWSWRRLDMVLAICKGGSRRLNLLVCLSYRSRLPLK